MLIEIIGWSSTILVLCGYWFNANNKRAYAFTTWIVGDIGWVTYDICIQNWSHLGLSATIISLNIFGMIQIYKNNKLIQKKVLNDIKTDNNRS